MYQRTTQGWLKHLDFIILDEISLQVAFALAYRLRIGGWLPYADDLYRVIAVTFVVLDLMVMVMLNSMHAVLKRGYYREFSITVRHCLLVFLLMILWLFMLKNSVAYSRIMLFVTFFLHIAIGYGTRLLWKRHLIRSGKSHPNRRALLIVAEQSHAPAIVGQLKQNLDGYRLKGLVLVDESDEKTQAVDDVPVVCSIADTPRYICREWVDGVYIACSEEREGVQELIERCVEMGVTVHYLVPAFSRLGSKSFMEKVGGNRVVTITGNTVTPMQAAAKRTMDIVGGLIGSFIALIVIAVVAPIIKKASPGPVLYKSERIGLNGKHFTMYKIRTMQPDAEARKFGLMAENRVKDGMMFKLDFDPRVIGNEILPDGTQKTGIGEFLRRTSLDEFPQFFSTIRGDMSLVGTRPPTVDEWEKYQYHHRARLAVKPGITGMWQVSGRSEIKDFEQVVRLDTSYMQNWSIGLDIKILLKTILVVFQRRGAI